MIPLKINNITYNIPTVDQLTVEKWFKLTEIKDFTIIDYLSIVLDIDYKLAENFRIKNHEFLAYQLYGTPPDYSIDKAKKFIVVKGRKYDLKTNFTLGQRFLIEENGKKKQGNELLIYILAVTANQDNYTKLIKDIMQEPARDIIPEAFFLLRNFSGGKNYVLNFLRMLRRLTRIKN